MDDIQQPTNDQVESRQVGDHVADMQQRTGTTKEIFRVLFSDKKKVIGLIAVVVVSIGVVAGVFLIGEQKVFRSKADIEPITFKDASGNPLPVENGVPVTNSTSVKVELRAPAP